MRTGIRSSRPSQCTWAAPSTHPKKSEKEAVSNGLVPFFFLLSSSPKATWIEKQEGVCLQVNTPSTHACSMVTTGPTLTKLGTQIATLCCMGSSDKFVCVPPRHNCCHYAYYTAGWITEGHLYFTQNHTWWYRPLASAPAQSLGHVQ